jgi:beta-N-acetylhexosaminidase
LRVGAVILFRRNLGSVAEIADLTADLHALPSRPFVCIDHEGGRVLRVGDPFTAFPPAAAVGRTGDPQLAYQVGRAMAAELGSVGIDLNFAPVLDLQSNPANRVIGDRSFGADPALVGTMGVAFLRGLLDGGLLGCGKHFPGHGDTAGDSHLELPVVDRPRAVLEDEELRPFRGSIGAGIPMLMTAHVLYPALDREQPATTSPRIVTQLLRDQLGFTGVVATDALEMRAITARLDVARAAVASLTAGCDLLLICQDLGQAAAAAAAIEEGVAAGTLSADVVRGAAKRVEALPWPRREGGRGCVLPNAEHRALVEEILRA